MLDFVNKYVTPISYQKSCLFSNQLWHSTSIIWTCLGHICYPQALKRESNPYILVNSKRRIFWKFSTLTQITAYFKVLFELKKKLSHFWRRNLPISWKGWAWRYMYTTLSVLCPVPIKNANWIFRTRQGSPAHTSTHGSLLWRDANKVSTFSLELFFSTVFAIERNHKKVFLKVQFPINGFFFLKGFTALKKIVFFEKKTFFLAVNPLRKKIR